MGRRDLARLKDDIRAYRAAAPGTVFRVEHQFGDGSGNLATRLSAQTDDAGASRRPVVAGLNISRWDDGRLAEEWAVWEAPGAPDGD